MISAPPDTLSLVPATGVRDPVFAVLIGYVMGNHLGMLTGSQIAAWVDRLKRPTNLPYQRLLAVTRTPQLETPEMSVEAVFDADIDLPIPYKILIYHPGSFQGTARLRFREVDLGRQEIAHWVEEKKQIVYRPFAIEDTYLFILDRGRFDIDIDGWLDAVAGSKLDDTRVAGLLIFRKESAVYGMALGYNRQGEGRSGTIDFGRDKVMYPSPPEFKSVAQQIRRQLEAYAPSIREQMSRW